MDNHPVLREMQELGCCDVSQVDLAFQVYMELCEGLLLWDVSYRYLPELDLILVSAKRLKDAEPEVFVPISSSAEMNLEWLELLHETVGVESPLGTKLTLAIVDGDSTMVLHEMTRGLVAPRSDKRDRRKVDPASFLAPEIVRHATQQPLSREEGKKGEAG